MRAGLVLASLLAASAFAVDALAEPLSGTTGPYRAVMEMDATLPDHTVFRPEDLAAPGRKLPLLIFGNGGCINIGSLYKPLLGEIASQGYLAIATGPIGPEPEFPRNPGEMREPPPQSKTEALLAAIDWAIHENARTDSPYHGRIDTAKIAVGGHSCGGLQAIKVGADPRISTVLVLNSGIIRGGIRNPDGTTRQPFGVNPATEEDLSNLHTPVLYVVGGETDQAYRGAEADFAMIDGAPVFNANLPVGHGGTWRNPGGGEMGGVMLDWLDWLLKGDDAAGKTFDGESCGLCVNPAWSVKRKNWN